MTEQNTIQKSNASYIEVVDASSIAGRKFRILKAAVKVYENFMKQSGEVFPRSSYAGEIVNAALEFDSAVRDFRHAKEEHDKLEEKPDE